MPNNVEFNRQELDVLFHVMNNAYGAAFDSAAERALECDMIERSEFIRIYQRLIYKLANA